MAGNDNLYSLLAGRFSADLNKPFLLPPGGPALSFGALHEESARLAALLLALDVQPGDRVIVQVEKSAASVLLYLACLRAGAIYIPLNTAYTAAEVEYFMTDAEPALVVTAPHSQAALQSVAARLNVRRVMTLDADGRGSLPAAAAGLAPHHPVATRGRDDLAAIVYTSGTTGRSKGAMLSHGNLASNAQALHEIWRWQSDDVLLHALPIYHVHGLFVALHLAMLGASSVHFLPRFDAGKVLELLPRSTVMMGVPTFYTRLLAEPGFTREVAAGMRLFISGSAPLLPETHRDFTLRTGHHILERYGMTEAGMITSNPYDGERLPGTVGFPLPDVRVRIANEQGAALPAGQPGVLEFTGPNVFKGYWRMPDKTAAEFRDDGWFVTGDVAVQDESGRVSIVGRAKDMIITGGLNVYPREVEAEIDAIDGIKESAVIGVTHPDFGEGVIAVVVPESGAELKAGDVLAALKDHLARFKQPKRVFFTEQLPRNSMGKVQKNVLREIYADTFAASV